MPVTDGWKRLPVLLGNMTILLVAWMGTNQIGVGGLVVVTFAALVVFNGAFFLATKMRESRSNRRKGDGIGANHL